MEKYNDSSTVPVAVVILNWNGSRLLKEFLPKVVTNTNPAIARVIVADNGSTDDSLEVLRTDFPHVELMTFDTNHGFAGGYNLAVERCRDYPYVVLLNSDVACAPGWIDSLYEFMETHSDAGACQPKILSYREPEKFEYAGACGGFLDKNGYPYCRGRIFSEVETDRGQYDDPVEVFWATGAALMVRTKVYLECGGLDTEFFAHMEEIDLCWRILLAGWRIWAVPSAVVFHLGGGSLPASNPKKTYLNFRNNLLLLHKNLPDDVRGRKLLVRRLLDTVAWAKFVLTADFGNAGAVWRAHRHFARMRRLYTSHPQKNLLTSSRNILTDFYLRHKKTF